jgi:hypothetical protein
VFVTNSVPAGHVVQQPRAELVLRPAAGGGGDKGKKPSSDVGWLSDGAGI